MKKIIIQVGILACLGTNAIASLQKADVCLSISTRGSVSIQEIITYLEDNGYDVFSVEETPKDSDLYLCSVSKDGITVWVLVTARTGRITTHEEIIP